MLRVSVIIPVYNTGEYLRGCIASICNQTYRELQIIIIDDGSEAATARICDELAAIDSRIEVVHKPNEGVSAARNDGLALANGDVICFVDSDDTISEEMIEKLNRRLNETGADIAMCDAVTLRPGRPDEPDTIPDFRESCVISANELPPAMLTRLAGSACRCAYRRTDMPLAELRFPVGIKFSEDRIFNIAAMGLAKKIAYIKEPLYNRLIRPGSACFRFYADMTEQIVKMRSVLLDTVAQYWGPGYLKAYEDQIADQILYAVTNYSAPYNPASVKEKISSIKNLCNNAAIRECIENSGKSDLRSRLILAQAPRRLFAIGVMVNFIHRICRKGQYQQ